MPDSTMPTPTPSSPFTTPRPVRQIWVAAGVSGTVAAVATTLIAAAARAADVPLDVDGEQIPLYGFAQLTLVGALIGAVLASVLHKRATKPRRTFVVATAALTVLSIVPDFLIDASTLSQFTLALTHVVAAAIIIPALAGRIRP